MHTICLVLSSEMWLYSLRPLPIQLLRSDILSLKLECRDCVILLMSRSFYKLLWKNLNAHIQIPTKCGFPWTTNKAGQ